MASPAWRPPGGLRLAVLQPTSLCNLNCAYCYVPDRRVRGLMSDEVLEASARFLFEVAAGQEKVRFLWHAGEPLTAGVPFYERAFSILQRGAPPGVEVEHAVQTNGTLVTAEWCRFFNEHGVRVGLSIDGPEHVHDASRVSWAGRGSHRRVMRGYALLRDHGINPGALCVLTSESLNHPDVLYDFFAETGFESVAFNVEEAEGVHRTTSLASVEPGRLESRYRDFIRQIWRRWRVDPHRPVIREFDQELGCIQDLQADPAFTRQPDETVPFGIVTIRKDGAISTYSPELASTASAPYADFVLGNVMRDSLADVVTGEAFGRLARDVQLGRDACATSCAYYALCGGGFQSNRVAEHGSLLGTETTTCRVHRKTLTDVVVGELLNDPEGSTDRGFDLTAPVPGVGPPGVHGG